MNPGAEGLLGLLIAEVAEMRATLGEVLAALPIPETMTTGDIAARRRCSKSWLTSPAHPWRLPNFGLADEGEGVRRWRRETVRAWYESPTWEADHRAAWEAMPAAVRRAGGKA